MLLLWTVLAWAGATGGASDLAPEPTVEASGGAPSKAPTTYALAADDGLVYVLVKNDPSGFASAFGHDHAVVASVVSGAVTWDPADPGACDIEVTVPVSGLVVDPPGVRERLGLSGSTSDRARGQITENFRGPRQLHMAAHPDIAFRGSECAATGDGYAVTGALTLRGVTRTITVPMQIDADDDGLRARGAFDTTHTAFGFEPFTALAGTLRNQDALHFSIDVRGRPSASGAEPADPGR